MAARKTIYRGIKAKSRNKTTKQMEYKHALTLAYAWQQKTLRSADNENEAIFADMRICTKDELTWRIHLACHQLAAPKQIKSCFRKRTMRAEKGRTTKGTDHLMLLVPRLAQSSHSWSIWPHKLRNKLIIRELWTLFLIRWENIFLSEYPLRTNFTIRCSSKAEFASKKESFVSGS